MIDESIVRPRSIKGFRRKNALLIPCDFPKAAILRSFKKDIIKERNLGCGYLYLLRDRIILYQAVGAPAAVLGLESLIVSGAKQIIILGFCGSLNPRYRLTEAAVISKAISEEGTSKHYFPRRKTFHPSPTLAKTLMSKLQEKNLPFHTGSVVSIDAPYRETRSWLTQKQKRGIDLVDMETSAVFALAEYYNIEAAALLIITDEVSHKKWRIAFRSLRLEKKIKDYFLPIILSRS